MDSNPSSYRTEFDALGATNDKNDLKLKISKLEAYSRRLCLNLIDLQKNRRDITNETLALSEELECSRDRANEDDASSETDVRVLLRAKKSGCCAICKGYEDREAAWLDEFGLEETRDLSEPVKVSSMEELDGSACSCCVCCENRISYECDACDGYETVSRADSPTNSFTCFHGLTADIGTPYIGRPYRICNCERDGNAAERFRGGMDCLEAVPRYLDDECTCIVEIRRNGRSRESRTSRRTSNLCHSLTVWPYWDGTSESVGRLDMIRATDEEDSQIWGSDDDRAELQQDSTRAACAEAPTDKTTSTEALRVSMNKSALLQCRIEDDCKTSSNVLDPPDLLRCLEAIGEMSRRAKEDRGNIEDETFNKDLLTGLSVLFLVVLACVSRYSTFNSLLHHPHSVTTCVHRIFERIAELITAASFGISANFLVKLSTLFVAALVSISLVKCTASVARLYSCPQKLFVFSANREILGKFYESINRSARRIFFCVKSQYHLFSYFSWLVFGFLVGKVSRISDKWFLWSSRMSGDDAVVGSEINLL